jgi:hypothetical protein
MGERKFLRKVCMLGEFAVGKTNLASRFSQNVFDARYITTIGARVSKKDVQYKDANVTLMIWDLIGFLKYDKIITSYAKGSDAGILVFDVTRPDTFEAVENWADLFTKDEKKRSIVLLANKMDLGPKFEAESQGRELAKKRGWRFFTTSAKTGMNVEQAFLSIADVE